MIPHHIRRLMPWGCRRRRRALTLKFKPWSLK
jgi:hypothetical protein